MADAAADHGHHRRRRALEALLAAAPAGEPSSAKVLARLYLDHAKPAEAQRVLAVAVKHHPQDTALWDLRLQAAELPAKEKLYREMIKLFPEDGQHGAALGANLVQRAEYAEARKVLEPLTANRTPAVRSTAHYQLARACFEQGQLREALKHLDSAADADFTLLTDVKALEFKARVHAQLDEVKTAIETYRLGLDIDGKANDLLDPLVRLEWQAGEKTNALDHLRRYTVAVGKDAAGLVKAAELHLLLGRPDDALELLGRLPEESLSAGGHRVIGLAHLQRREYPQAILHLGRAGGDVAATRGLIDACLAEGKLSAALTALPISPAKELADRALLLDRLLQRRDAVLAQATLPKGTQTGAARAASKFLCAEHGLSSGWPREHIERLLRASLDQFELGPALALRGWLALEKGQLTKALADADKAIALKPAEARAYLVRGRVRLERGDSKALDDLTQAAQLSKRQDATVLHWLAAAQAQADRVEAALQTQQEAVRLRPGDTELLDQLRQMEGKLKSIEK